MHPHGIIREAWHWGPDTLARVESDPQARVASPPAEIAEEPWVDAVRRLIAVRARLETGEHVAAAGEVTRLRRTWREWVPTEPAAGGLLRAWVNLAAGHVAYGRSRFSTAMREYGAAARAFERCRDDRGLGVAWRGLGNVCQFAGLYADAADYYQRALRLAERVGDRPAAYFAEHNLGNIHAALGEFDLAETAYRRATVGLRRLGRGRSVYAMMVSSASAALKRGRPATALKRLEAGRRALGRVAPHAGFESEACAIASEARRQQGRLDEAGTLAARALHCAQQASDALAEICAHRERAAVHLARGDLIEADADVQRALDAAPRFGLPTAALVEVHELAAEVAKGREDWRRAVHHLDRARELRATLAKHAGTLQARSLTLRHELGRARQAADAAKAERERMGEALAQLSRTSSPSSVEARPSEMLTAEALRPLGLTERESEVLLWARARKEQRRDRHDRGVRRRDGEIACCDGSSANSG